MALAALLVGTAVLYLWGLGASGWANSFYAAAAQAGSESWKAFFFGSSDAASSITVDKTPLSLWPMALSIRLFGLSSWSLLVPQALEGVAAVALLAASVRRTTGSAWTGILAGATLALTPVAVLMFRFDNPDALLVLLLVGSVYATQRALEATWSRAGTGTGSGHPVRWLALGGALVGLAFLTKMLQAFLVLPALAVVYAVLAAVPLWRRLGHLLVAFAAMLVAGGWWVAVVELWPKSSRPWIGGSQHNSVLELTLGYNGFGRLTGDETGSVGGGNGWGEPGLLRLFDSDLGGQSAWLLPAALVLGVAALVLGRGRALRAGLGLWLGWLVVTGLTFSLMAGIFHAYYTVALAPAVAALVATGALVLWRARGSLVASGVLAGAMAMTAALAFALLDRSGEWHPWLKHVVLVAGLAAALALGVVRHLPRALARTAAVVALVAALTGPAAFSLTTAATPHTGSIPSAGPAGTSGPGGTPVRGGIPGGGVPGGAAPGAAAGSAAGGAAPNGATPNGAAPGGTLPGKGAGGASAGGLLTGSTPSAELTALLQTDADSYTWAAAAVGSSSAAGYQLASEEPVLAIGGFNGSDPSPTLAQFRTYVADGQVHYFVAGGDGRAGVGPGGAQMGGSQAAGEIATWVADNFDARTVDGVTVYDLSEGVR